MNLAITKPPTPPERWRRIYVASSWRNEHQHIVVSALRSVGHMVYDFKHPRPGNNGFHWSDCDPNGDWQKWSIKQYTAALDHPVAKAGFASDFNAMKWADTFVLVMPCGRSAHLEAGWACGQGKQVIVLLDEKFEPELMVKMCDQLCSSLEELMDILAG